MHKKSAHIGLVNPKSPTNVGMVMRAAGCYEATTVFYSGVRFERAQKFATDTKNAGSKIALVGVENLLDDIPDNATLVAIELIEGATPLMDFIHPDNAYYIFWPGRWFDKKRLVGSLPARGLYPDNWLYESRGNCPCRTL